LPDRLRRPGYRHQRRQIAPRRSEGARGGAPCAELSATAHQEGFLPTSAINWNGADDNNAFHAKQIVMDLDGSLSTEAAVLSQGKKQDYDDIVTMGLPLGNDGKPVPSQAGSFCGLIPKGAKNVAVAKDFLKYLIQPQVNNEYLKTGL